jgi:hemerythrin-like domain-containing protein
MRPVTPPSSARTSIRDRFLADHQRLEASLERLLAALAANEQTAVSRLWTAFASDLTAHLEAEEAHLIPALFEVFERDVRVIVQEHRHIRARLTELATAVESQTARLGSVRDFIDELRAHAHNEDRLLYRWTDAHLDEPQRTFVIDALSRSAETPAKRAGQGDGASKASSAVTSSSTFTGLVK